MSNQCRRSRQVRGDHGARRERGRQASTSNAKQRQGKQDWLKGSREENRGILQIRTALKSAIAGNKKAFKAGYIKGLKTMVAGSKLSAKGDKLLGLPTDD